MFYSYYLFFFTLYDRKNGKLFVKLKPVHMKKIQFFITDLLVRLFLHRLAAFYSPLKFYKVQ